MRMEQLLDEFNRYWEDHGKPDIGSKEYLNMNRAFFYDAGHDDGYEDAESSITSPDISDFVGDNIQDEILDAMDYSTIFDYVQRVERDKKDDEDE